MEGVVIATLIGVSLFVGGVVAWKTRLPAPLVLLALGIVLGYVPALGRIELPPELVLSLFLPALLYWESINTPVREVRRNLRVILMLSIPLVLVTAAAVAGAAHLAAFAWPVAIALGAIVAPTDATAVGPVTRLLPRRFRTTLRAESLINDGTALTIYAIAVFAIENHQEVDLGRGALAFVVAYAGGIVAGVVAAALAYGARRLVRGQTLLENTVSVLTPFVAYLIAEPVGASGVVAVVVCGLILTHFTPRLISARTRVQARGFWQLASGVVNAALFLLVGLQAHAVLDGLGGNPGPVLALGLLVAAVVMVVRLVWIYTTPYLIRALDRRPIQRTLRVSARQRLVTGWAGFRGAVSLAAALALPPGDGYPRDELIAITLVVIVVTLVVQGLTMPAVVRFARLPADPSELEEERLAEEAMRDAGAGALGPMAERLGTPDDIVERVRRQYEEAHPRTSDGRAPLWADGSEGELRRAVIAKKREAVIRLRDEGRIDDTILRRMEDRLDIEELRLSPIAADD
ncbi:Na+/H+ antiporter [Amnibacterium setariae]|uniref:Na+/H+ antiporter n=1 Tax=Amnibacterium setariae TaxID=2306585 RepID=A0A3A1U1P0_9MICO|nr:Na+/H+ antiporter [Amnibacterium setariae]RIX26537.1 Na+/H+ antiporter [Amnibacterium setariae]